MLIWSYWKTVFTAVGTVPKQFKVSPSDLERLEHAESQEVQRQVFEDLAKDLPAVTRTPLGGELLSESRLRKYSINCRPLFIVAAVRYCEKCVHMKPDRCHHCSVCGACVLKMDHVSCL